MSCSEYGLQGLHARIYIARETEGRVGEYQRLPPTFRSSNSFYVVLTHDLRYLPLYREQASEVLDQRPVKRAR